MQTSSSPASGRKQGRDILICTGYVFDDGITIEPISHLPEFIWPDGQPVQDKRSLRSRIIAFSDNHIKPPIRTTGEFSEFQEFDLSTSYGPSDAPQIPVSFMPYPCSRAQYSVFGYYIGDLNRPAPLIIPLRWSYNTGGV